ncbi:hypothetical protein BN2497_2611 [Janthinobacterium sp. CG23_2]|nr:hypothetical protein BN2497_2611 [Janthinobacterium sp. CG23_2]CUU27703.1 hypothetical protein BN3177_2611 [Janthinobacterium sp. CG23_2]
MRSPSKFTQEQHRKNLAKMMTHLEARGPLPAKGIADALGLPAEVIKGYLYRMNRAGEIHSQKLRTVSGHVATALYWFGPGNKSPLAGEVQTCRTVKTFPKHAVRDELVAALFGAAQQQ